MHSPYLKQINTNTFTMCFLMLVQFERNVSRQCHRYIKHLTGLINLVMLGFVLDNRKGINVNLKLQYNYCSISLWTRWH